MPLTSISMFASVNVDLLKEAWECMVTVSVC